MRGQKGTAAGLARDNLRILLGNQSSVKRRGGREPG